MPEKVWFGREDLVTSDSIIRKILVPKVRRLIWHGSEDLIWYKDDTGIQTICCGRKICCGRNDLPVQCEACMGSEVPVR